MKFLKLLLIEILSFIMFFINSCPGKTGVSLRKFFLKIMLKELGEEFYSENGLSVSGH